MSTYEKIVAAVVAVVLVLMVIFSYHEIKEPSGRGEGRIGARFDESRGQDFKIGAFATVVDEASSSDTEDACELQKPVIIAVLHDIKIRLESQKILAGDSAFEVNDLTLQLFCHKDAAVTLSDKEGNRLVLHKLPFVRAVPPQSTAEDIGTTVRINATVIPAGVPVPKEPTTFGELLIPDRFLDAKPVN
jgi:hypothetical protein